MYAVHFYNFGYTKHFDTKEQAIAHARNSGFQCVVYDPNNNQVFAN